MALVRRPLAAGPRDVGADVVFQCRGQASVLGGRAAGVRPQGSVIDLAFYQGGAPELRLGEEFHHKGVAIRCAQIGRVPRGLAPALGPGAAVARSRWTCSPSTATRCARHVVTDVVPFDDGPAAMVELAERRRSTIQTVFAV